MYWDRDRCDVGRPLFCLFCSRVGSDQRGSSPGSLCTLQQAHSISKICTVCIRQLRSTLSCTVHSFPAATAEMIMQHTCTFSFGVVARCTPRQRTLKDMSLCSGIDESGAAATALRSLAHVPAWHVVGYSGAVVLTSGSGSKEPVAGRICPPRLLPGGVHSWPSFLAT
jgi:hypothetical protein